jgi:hypothetical protein
MSAIVNEAPVVSAAPPIAAEEREVSEGTSLARYCTLEEVLGLVFGVLTVAYIVLSLASLAL